MPRMLLRHNEWLPPEVQESTRRRICCGSRLRTLCGPGRAQEEHHGLRVMGLAERQEETGEAPIRYLYPRAAGDGGLVTGKRRNARRHGVDRSLLETGVEHPGGAV